jgi:hypothetical protein
MRAIRSHRHLAPIASEYPGTTPSARFGLHVRIVEALDEAQRAATPWSSVVLHVEPDAVRLRSRSEVVAELREAGVAPLAKELERALVPRTHCLVLLDLDGRTLVNVVDRAAVLEQP